MAGQREPAILQLINYGKDYIPVAVIDCDFPQHSIMEMRKRDKESKMGIHKKRNIVG